MTRKRDTNAQGTDVQNVQERVGGALEDLMARGGEGADRLVNERLSRMLGVVKASAEGAAGRVSSIDEDDVLTFIPDRRRVGGVGLITFGLLCLVLLPGLLKGVGLVFLALGLLGLVSSYVLAAKVDVPDGYAGVVCRYGEPLPGSQARTGRNWLLSPERFIPFLVSQRDQVVDLESANFTADFASISLGQQLVFRVTDPAKFVATSSPALLMNILSAYATYLNLRIVGSVRDARVKFSGRDRIDNVVAALNRDLAGYGAEVVRGSLPSSHNEVLGELETIRTLLKEVEAMEETQRVRLESAVKAVESGLRARRKETRSRALELQQARVVLDTAVAEQVNTERQAYLIAARRRLEEAFSEVSLAVAEFKGSWAKTKELRASLESLEVEFEVREARLKRKLWQALLPETVEVVAVQGAGLGVSLTAGRRLLRALSEGEKEG